MRDEDDGLAQIAPQRQQIVVEPEAGDLVERGERFVHQENIRIGDQRARQRDPHLHAAGQFARIGVGEFGQPDLRQRFADARVRLGGRHMRQFQRQPYIPAHAGPRHQRRLLKHKADGMLRTQRIGVVCDADGAGGRHVQACDQAQRGRLAAAGRPEQRDELALAHIEVQRTQRHHPALIDLRHLAQAHREAGCAGSAFGQGCGLGHVGSSSSAADRGRRPCW